MTAEVSPGALGSSGEANGFERATSYIGEYGSVLMAAVVDREGLLLSSFARGESSAEDWAPLSLLFLEDNKHILRRGGWQVPEKIALTLNDVRIIVTGDGDFSLMVVAEREYDDVLSIRISQGLEIIRKYVAERYGDKLFVNAERAYA